MEDYFIAKFVRRIIAPIVIILILCSTIYGWWIGDYPAAFETVYMTPMQYVVGLMIQPRLNRLEKTQDRMASTTNQLP